MDTLSFFKSGAATGNMQQKSGSKEKQAIYDLEEIVLIWAKQIFQATKTKEQSRLSQDCLQFNINWSHVRFQFGTPIYEGIPRFGGGSLDRLTSGKVQPRLLYKAVFANRTDHKQEYTFKAERISASICSVTTENGFSRGANFAIKLKTPDDILAANAGFRRDILVCNFDEDTVEEELRWGVDSVVMVPPMTETTAELVMTEAQCTANFSMHVRFNGRVIVTVTDAKSNNALVTIIEGNMADIMQNEIAKGCKAFKLDKRTVVGESSSSEQKAPDAKFLDMTNFTAIKVHIMKGDELVANSYVSKYNDTDLLNDPKQSCYLPNRHCGYYVQENEGAVGQVVASQISMGQTLKKGYWREWQLSNNLAIEPGIITVRL